ncbi:uncharacterized protein [Montipora foliosa]|uniref:uncharacterized protein isoform X1 n=2 Tax=Montipora foliosa TaxID=591990 RepID=UPI0035F1D935
MDSLHVKSMAEYATKGHQKTVRRTYAKREDDTFKAGPRVDGDLDRSLIAASDVLVKSMAEYATKEHQKTVRQRYAKTFKAGARVDGDLDRSLIAARAQGGLKVTDWGATIGAGAECHFYQVTFTKRIEVSARILGADAVAYVGVDLEALVEEGSLIGAEARARATLSEFKAGPLHAHFGLGASAAAKVEGGALELKIFGCGLTVGKRIGLSVFDNNVSVESAALVGKNWLW